MYTNDLTKEEIKTLKQGYAYRSWKKRTNIAIVVALAWIFGGIPLAHISNVTAAIHFIVSVLVVIMEFRVLVMSSWKCPKCQTKLPSQNAIGGSATVSLPFLVKTCPHCGLDLTMKKEELV